MGNASRDLRLCGVPQFCGRWVMAQATKAFNREVRKEKHAKDAKKILISALNGKTPREKTRGVSVRKGCFS
jgi:hypothetical protein